MLYLRRSLHSKDVGYKVSKKETLNMLKYPSNTIIELPLENYRFYENKLVNEIDLSQAVRLVQVFSLGNCGLRCPCIRFGG